MNTKTARLIKRYVAVTDPSGKRGSVRRAKRNWNRTPARQRCTLRRKMQAVVDRATAGGGQE